MGSFQFGTLVVLPEGKLREIAHSLREKHDPESARVCAPHLTVTQPFLRPPTESDRDTIARLVADVPAIDAQIGPYVSSPNGKMLWMQVAPQEPLLALREKLHATELFNLGLPLTRGFIFHLTISEAMRPPEEVQLILKELNSKTKPWACRIAALSWITHPGNGIFRARERFELKG